MTSSVEHLANMVITAAIATPRHSPSDMDDRHELEDMSFKLRRNEFHEYDNPRFLKALLDGHRALGGEPCNECLELTEQSHAMSSL